MHLTEVNVQSILKQLRTITTRTEEQVVVVDILRAVRLMGVLMVVPVEWDE
jgi:hypothetical protein